MAITKAEVEWEGFDATLTIEATSSASPDAVLTTPDVGVNLPYDEASDSYRVSVPWGGQIPEITVFSDHGGAATSPVTEIGNPFEDSDGDGLVNFEESEFWGTDPLNPDTDGDTFTDGQEVGCGSIPTDAASVCPPPAIDSDGDGLPDDDEDILGTDPLNPDSDGDFLLDGEEVAYGTDPNNPDTDGDGWSDFDERQCPEGDPLNPAATCDPNPLL